MGGCQGVIVVCSHGDLLPAEADIIIIERVGIRTAGFEHEVIGVVKRQAVDEDMSAFVAVTVKTLN